MFGIKHNVNSCDGCFSGSIDIHFTKICDNDCAHCIDKMTPGKCLSTPEPIKIAKSVIRLWARYPGKVKDVLFLGGEPCLFLDELIECIKTIKSGTNREVKCYVTSAMPFTVYKEKEKFFELLGLVDGFNLSIQSSFVAIAEYIRRRPETYDRNTFYASLPHKEKIRCCYNLTKELGCITESTKEELLRIISRDLKEIDKMRFGSIKINELQHCHEKYVSFEDIFGKCSIGSPFAYGCQTKIDLAKEYPIDFESFKTPVILKRSCFLCETSRKASIPDFIKAVERKINQKNGKTEDVFFRVIYENGIIEKGWV